MPRAMLPHCMLLPRLLQSQSEDFEEFEGDVDTDMSYDEFLEAILRIGVKLAGADSPFDIEQK